MLKPRLIGLALVVVTSLLPACSLFPSGPPPPRSYSVSLSDVDGDGDLDAVVGNGPSYSDYGPRNADGSSTPNAIWLNDGAGHFTDSGQWLVGNHKTDWDRTHAVALGDLDGDGDTDVVFGNAIYSPNTVGVNTLAHAGDDLWSPNTVWLSDGAGQFALHGEYRMEPNGEFDYGVREAVALGDLDLDGDLDAYVANCCRTERGVVGAGSEITPVGHSNAYNTVWLNDGTGRFTDSGQRLGNWATGAVALGDLDGDGDLDAFEVNLGGRSESIHSVADDMVWLNDGTGHFSDSEQRLGHSDGSAVALGDLDGDGDLDAFVGNAHLGRADEVWLNDGGGNFADSKQRLGDANTRIVVLDDVDGDGDLDAFVGNEGFGQTWMNDGSGRFTDSGQRFNWSSQYAVNLADVDSDGDKDVFAIRFDGDVLVWQNNGTGRFGRGNWAMAPIYLAVGGVVVLGLILLGWRVVRRKKQS
jgi:hypothetical protein